MTNYSINYLCLYILLYKSRKSLEEHNSVLHTVVVVVVVVYIQNLTRVTLVQFTVSGTVQMERYTAQDQRMEPFDCG